MQIIQYINVTSFGLEVRNLDLALRDLVYQIVWKRCRALVVHLATDRLGSAKNLLHSASKRGCERPGSDLLGNVNDGLVADGALMQVSGSLRFRPRPLIQRLDDQRRGRRDNKDGWLSLFAM